MRALRSGFILAGAAAVVLPLLAGCRAVGPDYRRPEVPAAEQFRGQPPAAATQAPELAWRDVYRDPELQALIAEALVNNYDVRIAISRVEQARAVVAQARAGFFPTLNGEYGGYRGYNAQQGSPVISSKNVTTNSAIGALNAAWVLDVWGGIRRQNEADFALYLASNEGRRDVMVILVGELAQAYFELLAMDRDLAIAKQMTVSFRGSLKMFEEQLRGGVASTLDTSRASAALTQVQADIPQFTRQIALQENLICLLVGRNPGPVTRGQPMLEQKLTEIPAGLPSSLLERRPDIRQAEQKLRAANAQIGVATANLLPQFSLTGLGGSVNQKLSAFGGDATGVASIGGMVTAPLFNGGLLWAQRKQTIAARNEARLQYQQKVLIAFKEVADALVAKDTYMEQRAFQEQTVKSLEKAVDVSTKRYLVEKASYFEIIESQQQLYSAALSLTQTQLAQLTQVVQLYGALGGGWEDNPVLPPAPAAPAPGAATPAPALDILPIPPPPVSGK
jgi:multidrug efflux system outer membrane protein